MQKDIILPSSLLEGTVSKERGREQYSTLKIFEKENWPHAYQFLYQYVRGCKESKKMVLAYEQEDNDKKRNAEFFCHYNPTTVAFCLVTYINNFDVWKELAELKAGGGQLEGAQEEGDGNEQTKQKATSRYTKQRNASLELKSEYKKILALTHITILKHMNQSPSSESKFQNLWEEFLDGYFKYIRAVKARKMEEIEKENVNSKRKQPKEHEKNPEEEVEDILNSMGLAF